MHRFDLRKTILPFSLLDICKRLKTMSPGDTLEVLGSGPGMLSDLRKILPAEAFEIGPAEEIQGNAAEYRLKIKKIKNTSNQGGTSCLTSI